MRRKTVYRAIEGIDRDELEQFQAGMRKRYSDEHILDELRACAKRLGRSPTMREFEADPGTTVHPQTVIEHFKSWNRAKRLAGLVPRRFATQEELLKLLRDLGDELGRVPTAKDIEARKGAMPSKSLYWHTFGSLNNALKQAGFDVLVECERFTLLQDVAQVLQRAHKHGYGSLVHGNGHDVGSGQPTGSAVLHVGYAVHLPIGAFCRAAGKRRRDPLVQRGAD